MESYIECVESASTADLLRACNLEDLIIPEDEDVMLLDSLKDPLHEFLVDRVTLDAHDFYSRHFSYFKGCSASGKVAIALALDPQDRPENFAELIAVNKFVLVTVLPKNSRNKTILTRMGPMIKAYYRNRED